MATKKHEHLWRVLCRGYARDSFTKLVQCAGGRLGLSWQFIVPNSCHRARTHEAMATFDKLSNIQHTILRRIRARAREAVGCFNRAITGNSRLFSTVSKRHFGTNTRARGGKVIARAIYGLWQMFSATITLTHFSARVRNCDNELRGNIARAC